MAFLARRPRRGQSPDAKPMKKIAIIGHSHIVALLNAIGEWRKPANMDAASGDSEKDLSSSFRGWRSINTSGKLFEILPHDRFEKFRGTKVSLLTEATPGSSPLALRHSEGEQHFIQMTPLMKEFLDAVAGFDAVISVLHGGDHTFRSLLNDMPEYDFVPFEDDGAGYCPIDISYINLLMETQVLALVYAPLAAMRMTLPNTKIIHIAPPPPLEDPSIVRFRASLDRLLRDFSAKIGITLVEPSKDCVSESGFLKPDYSEDLAHGNVEYGRVLAGRVADLI